MSAHNTVSFEVTGEGGYDFAGATAEGTNADALALEVEEARLEAEREMNRQINDQWSVYPLELPQTGVLTGESRGNDVIIRTPSDSGNYYVMFFEIPGDDYTADGELALTVFIRGGERYTARLPVGNYKLIYGTGKLWYGEEHMFGSRGSYNRMDGVIESENGYYSEVTLYVVEGGNTGLTPIPFP